MLIFCIVFIARAGHPGVFTGNTFLDTSENLNPDSLQSKVTNFQNIINEVGDAKNELADLVENFHKFKGQVAKQVLLEILTRDGLKEFNKELAKCGISDKLQDEDLVLVQGVCNHQNKIEVLVEVLIKQVNENANVCINVKEKYRAQIQDLYDEYFYKEDSQAIEVQEKVTPAPILIQMENIGKRLDVIYLKNKEKLEKICLGFLEFKEKILGIRQSTFEQLGSVIV